MPPKKKAAGSSKKGNRGNKSETMGPPPSASQAASNSPVRPSPSAAMPATGDFPTWDQPPPARSQHAGGGIIQHYKEATERFKKGLLSLCPHSLAGSDRVQTLVDAADYLAEQHQAGESIQISSQLIADVKTAIKVRSSVAKAFDDGGDEGHSYFILALAYCASVLRQISNSTLASEPQEVEALGNRFAALQTDDDDEEKDEDALEDPVEQLIHEATRPNEPVTEYSITQDLVRGSDRFQAMIFINSLDELMGFTIEQYQSLKTAWRDGEVTGRPRSSHIEQLMECTVYTNATIQHVRYLEGQLALDHPHLNSIYRVFAVLVLVEIIGSFKTMVTENSPNAAEFPLHAATEFVGDLLECAFRNPSDPYNRHKQLVKDFATMWKLNYADVLSRAESIKITVQFETPLFPEESMNLPIRELIGSMVPVRPGSWFTHLPSIGNDRSIVKTQRLLQCLSNVQKTERLQPKRGFFGRPWNEKGGKAQKISGDMDEFLMADVIPLLFEVCSGGLASTKLPRGDELLPLFASIKEFLRRPNQPVPVSLTFGIHALLVSVFEMQGHDDVHHMAETAKQCFELYLSQLEDAQASVYPHAPIWESNLKKLLILKFLPEVAHPKPSDAIVERAMWNPLLAGMHLTYLAYFANLEGGCALIDSFAQLRMVLHLYNALLEIGACGRGLFPVLDMLFDHFANVKAIWEGTAKPKQGEFVKRWWIAYGMRPDVAQRCADETRSYIISDSPGRSSQEILFTRTGDATRDMTPINPEDLSKSFRRICLRDYDGVVDNYHNARQRREGAGTAQYEHAVRTNDTLDAMDKEQKLLALNLIAMGDVLNEFTYKLFEAMDWTEIVARTVQSTPDSIKKGRRMNSSRVRPGSWVASDTNYERYTMMLMFSQGMLGVLDFVHGVSRPGARAMACFELFFNRGLDPARVMFFTPTEEEEEEKE